MSEWIGYTVRTFSGVIVRGKGDARESKQCGHQHFKQSEAFECAEALAHNRNLIDNVEEDTVVEHERGAVLVEYALLVALIAIVCLASITFLGNAAAAKFSQIAAAVSQEAVAPAPGATTTTTAQHNCAKKSCKP